MGLKIGNETIAFIILEVLSNFEESPSFSYLHAHIYQITALRYRRTDSNDCRSLKAVLCIKVHRKYDYY